MNDIQSPIASGDDDEDETVVDLDEVNKDKVTPKNRNVDAEQLALEQQNDKSLALFFFG